MMDKEHRAAVTLPRKTNADGHERHTAGRQKHSATNWRTRRAHADPEDKNKHKQRRAKNERSRRAVSRKAQRKRREGSKKGEEGERGVYRANDSSTFNYAGLYEPIATLHKGELHESGSKESAGKPGGIVKRGARITPAPCKPPTDDIPSSTLHPKAQRTAKGVWVRCG